MLCALLVTACGALTGLLRGQARDDAATELSSNAALTASSVSAHVGSLQDLVTAWADRPELVAVAAGARGGSLAPTSAPAARRLMVSLSLAHRGVRAAFLVDASGLTLMNEPLIPAALGRNFSDREWYRTVTSTGAPTVTSSYRSILPGHPWVVAAAAPVWSPRSAGGRHLVGVLVATVDLSGLQAVTDVYRTSHLGRASRVAVVDGLGQVLAATGRPSAGEVLPRDLASTLVSTLRREGRRRADLLPAAAPLDSADRRPAAQLASVADVPGLSWRVLATRPTASVTAVTARSVLSVRALTSAVVLLLLVGAGAWSRTVGRRRRELALAQERLRGLRASSPVGLVETDLGQRITSTNAAFVAMVGGTESEVLGRFGWEFLHVDSPQADPQAVVELLAGTRSSYSAQRLLRAYDGSPLPVKLDWSVVRDRDGHPVELACVVTDVSAQAAAAAAVDAARERAEVLWDRAPVGIIEGTADGTITSDNDALLAMLGRRREDLVGSPATELADPAYAPTISAGLSRLLAGQSCSAERRYLHADGRSLPVYVSTAVMHDEHGQVARLVGFVVDMSEAHAQRSALSDALRQVALAKAELERRQAFTDRRGRGRARRHGQHRDHVRGAPYGP